jgi:D-alanyl-lipoteichoic acid acyltransferase DltB (MBOAT superfamily)
MDSASFSFVSFGILAAIISSFSQSSVWRSAVLCTFSAIFLLFLAPHLAAIIPLIGFLIAGYAAVVLVRRFRGGVLPACTITTVFAYCWLKKYTFLPESIFLKVPYLTVGLSYIFFRVMQLIIRTGEASQTKHMSIFSYFLYMLNFTTLISGPIQSYEDFARDQFADNPIGLDKNVVATQLGRIIRGFFKVNVVATLLNFIQLDAVTRMSLPLPHALKILAAGQLCLVYPLFLYANFSGYIDIVIGIARLMRLRLPENFNRPFSASSFLDFWNRWHITLSTWLKTYVYNPLLITLMRRITSVAMQPFLGLASFFVTFFLIGIWHGRTSEFVFFGVLQGAGVTINKLWQLEMAKRLGRGSYKRLADDAIYRSFGRGLTFTWFSFTLFWFWGTWKQLDVIFGALDVWQWSGLWLAAWLLATVVLGIWEWLRGISLSIRDQRGNPLVKSRYLRMAIVSAMALAAVVFTVLLNQPAPGIVYKAF